MREHVLRADAGLFYCPIPSALHPRVAELDLRSLAWLNEMGLCTEEQQRKRALANNSAEFFARITPRGVDERLQIAVDWTHYGFIFDDLVSEADLEAGGESGSGSFLPLASKLLRMIQTRDPSLAEKVPLLRPMHDIAVRFARCSSAVQFRRWVDAIRLWMFGVAHQRALRAMQELPSINTYLTMRLHDCGGAPVTAMLEIVNDAEVPGHEMDSPAVRALTEMTWLIAALDNERMSRAKELHGERSSLNLVNVCMQERGCGVEQASRDVIAMRDRMMCLFLHLRDQVLTTASPALRLYLEDLGTGIRGNIEWSLRTARYTAVYDPEGRPAGTVDISSGWALEPSDASLEPLPIPSIAWWWEQVQGASRMGRESA